MRSQALKKHSFTIGLVAALSIAGMAVEKPVSKPGVEGKPKITKSNPAPGAGVTKDKTGALVEDKHPERDAAAMAATIDHFVDAALVREKIPVSPQADDAEFLRRVTIDIIGRIPASHEARAFFASSDPDKRARWIDALLASPAYGDHFGTIWRELIMPPDGGVKGGRDEFTPWLATQFNRNRGWDKIVVDLLTVTGRIREQPQSAFVMACSDNTEPQPNLLADTTSRLFWGVQLRCAECHDHPFADWKQEDFWGIAAFFGRTRKGGDDGKNPLGWTITEAALRPDENWMPPRDWLPEGVQGAVVRAPGTSGKSAGLVYPARFLGGDEARWEDEGPYRERFAAWAVSAENPWFARNAVNRLWATFFTSGLVTPLDGFNGDETPTHPELLEELTREFIASEFDLKHLIRCICRSRAYQRGSLVLEANARDEQWVSHWPVRVMRPEVLYDSISMALQSSAPKGGSKPMAKGGVGFGSIDRARPIPNLPREDFVRFFASRPDENEGSIVNQGIPQWLRLMNGALLSGGDVAGDWPPPSSKNIKGDDSTPKNPKAPRPGEMTTAMMDKLKPGQSGGTGGKLTTFVTETTTPEDVYLAAYSRLPTEEERALLSEFAAGRADGAETADALLWVLLNSAEFVTNH